MWFVIQNSKIKRNETDKLFYHLQLQLLRFFLSFMSWFYSTKSCSTQLFLLKNELANIVRSWERRKSEKIYTKWPFIENLILFASAFTRLFNSFFILWSSVEMRLFPGTFFSFFHLQVYFTLITQIPEIHAHWEPRVKKSTGFSSNIVQQSHEMVFSKWKKKIYKEL